MKARREGRRKEGSAVRVDFLSATTPNGFSHVERHSPTYILRITYSRDHWMLMWGSAPLRVGEAARATCLN
ncbi:hypothetical protein B296_00002376 [Ensete ventricosum]|uniref:Uncharacterized protein n=1 Tax=Ensete ventricosum TaxID=4639 RepID=A0A427AXQ8_ENSVE|nr:hypothetical protein B296_00002376 [Ensete ventricosum]